MVQAMREPDSEEVYLPLKAQKHEMKIREAMERALGRELEPWQSDIAEETAIAVNDANTRANRKWLCIWGVFLFIAAGLATTFAIAALEANAPVA